MKSFFFPRLILMVVILVVSFFLLFLSFSYLQSYVQTGHTTSYYPWSFGSSDFSFSSLVLGLGIAFLLAVLSSGGLFYFIRLPERISSPSIPNPTFQPIHPPSPKSQPIESKLPVKPTVPQQPKPGQVTKNDSEDFVTNPSTQPPVQKKESPQNPTPSPKVAPTSVIKKTIPESPKPKPVEVVVSASDDEQAKSILEQPMKEDVKLEVAPPVTIQTPSQPEPEISPEWQSRMTEDSVPCISCGAPIPPIAKFCPDCGTVQSPPEEPETPKEERQEDSDESVIQEEPQVEQMEQSTESIVETSSPEQETILLQPPSESEPTPVPEPEPSPPEPEQPESPPPVEIPQSPPPPVKQDKSKRNKKEIPVYHFVADPRLSRTQAVDQINCVCTVCNHGPAGVPTCKEHYKDCVCCTTLKDITKLLA